MGFLWSILEGDGVAKGQTLHQSEQKENRGDLRLLSHTIVDVRPFRYVPLFTQSCFLLDISTSGVLLEFVTSPQVKTGRRYWAISHLTPLGITEVQRFKCHLECRWVNVETCKMGAQFVDLTPQDKETLALIINRIRGK